MWYPLRNLYRDSIVRWLSIVVVIGCVAQWGVAFWFATRESSSFLLLHYSVDYGIDFTGPWQYVLRIPLVSTLVFVCNSVLAYLLFYVARQYAYVLLAVSFLVLIVLSIGLGQAMYLNL
ncbi:MAG: hypothetical protein AAB384_01630 [Patescibacteria group bacterium]